MLDKDKFNDDFCDIYSKKLCDNCGKCLELDGVDIRAINIEDIAKNVEENQYLEDQLKEAKEMLENEDVKEDSRDDEFKFDSIDYNEDEDYKDAFDNIVYFDDIGLEDDANFDELTEEVYPGVRKFKN